MRQLRDGSSQVRDGHGSDARNLTFRDFPHHPSADRTGQASSGSPQWFGAGQRPGGVFAAQPAGQVFLPDTGGQTGREPRQDFVANGAAKPVVHTFEVIDTGPECGQCFPIVREQIRLQRRQGIGREFAGKHEEFNNAL
jgi:hypothetical protein